MLWPIRRKIRETNIPVDVSENKAGFEFIHTSFLLNGTTHDRTRAKTPDATSFYLVDYLIGYSS